MSYLQYIKDCVERKSKLRRYVREDSVWCELSHNKLSEVHPGALPVNEVAGNGTTRYRSQSEESIDS